MYKMKEFAELTGMTERAIRYYEEKGLLSPTKNPETKYRSFSEQNVLEAKQISFLKNCGLSMEEMGTFLEFYRKGEIAEEMQDSVITRYFQCLREFEEKYKQKESLQLLIKDMIQAKKVTLEEYNAEDYGFSQVIDGMPDIHKAAFEGDLEKVKYSVETIHNVNEVNFYGMTPLIFASMAGNKEVVEYLIQNGAIVDVEDDQGGTPLVRAAIGEQTEIMEILIKAGANVNFQGYLGDTPLMAVAYHNRPKAAKLLLENGADTVTRCKKLRGGQYHNAIECARYSGAKEIEEMLSSYPV